MRARYTSKTICVAPEHRHPPHFLVQVTCIAILIRLRTLSQCVLRLLRPGGVVMSLLGTSMSEMRMKARSKTSLEYRQLP